MSCNLNTIEMILRLLVMGMAATESELFRLHGRSEDTGDTHIADMKVGTIHSKLLGSFVVC